VTTRNAYLAGMKPSPLMVRILSAAVFLGLVLIGVYAGIYGVYALVLILGGLALWEFGGLSEGMGSRAPAWLLFPLGAFFAFSGTVLKEIDVGELTLTCARLGRVAGPHRLDEVGAHVTIGTRRGRCIERRGGAASTAASTATIPQRSAFRPIPPRPCQSNACRCLAQS